LVPNELQLARVLLGLLGAFAIVCSLVAFDPDAGRVTIFGLGVALIAFAALLPILDEHFELPFFKGKLRRELAQTIQETGKAEGIPPQALDRLTQKLDEHLESARRGAAQRGVMVCMECGAVARLDPASPYKASDPEVQAGLRRIDVACRNCGSQNFRLPN
jgi:ribosomal protein L40E